MVFSPDHQALLHLMYYSLQIKYIYRIVYVQLQWILYVSYPKPLIHTISLSNRSSDNDTGSPPTVLITRFNVYYALST